MNKEPLITVIIPIYNVEKYLKQCLDSLLYQTVCNHKVILVNDGSQDRSGEIAKQYAKKNPEMFSYYEQENAGQGAARNVGIHMLDTQYTMFLDSDDWLMPRFIERIADRLREEPEKPDIIFTLPYIYNMSSNCFEDWLDKPLFDQLFCGCGVTINPKEDARIYALEPCQTRRVYLTQFLKAQNFLFPEGTKWEDVEPHFQLVHAARRCIGESSVGFYYRVNSGNQTTSSVGTNRLQIVSVFSRTLSNAYQSGWTSIEIAYIIKMMFQFSKWSIVASAITVRKELVKRLHELYRVIPHEDLKLYYKIFGISRRDRAFVKGMRSPFYKIIGLPAYYNRISEKLQNFWRKIHK